jgi:hypothetical protein
MFLDDSLIYGINPRYESNSRLELSYEWKKSSFCALQITYEHHT